MKKSSGKDAIGPGRRYLNETRDGKPSAKNGPGRRTLNETRDGKPSATIGPGRSTLAGQGEKASLKRAGVPQNRHPLWHLALITAGAAILVLLFFFSVVQYDRSIPLEVKFRLPENIVTTTGAIDSVSFGFSANKAIRTAAFSYKSGEREASSTGGAIEIGDGGREIMATLPAMQMDVGSNEIRVAVTDLYGKTKEASFYAEYEIGFIAPPEEKAVRETKEGLKVISNELIVRMKENTAEQAADTLFEKYGGRIVGRIYMLNHYQVRFEHTTEIKAIDQILGKIEKEPVVAFASHNIVLEAEPDALPKEGKWDSWEDVPGGNNWGLEAIDAPEAWAHDQDFKAVKVGVLDGVINSDHEDLNIQPNNLFINPSNDFRTYKDLEDYVDQNPGCMSAIEIDDPGIKDHGSHVAGIIGATANNKKGITGVNWHADVSFAAFDPFVRSGGVLSKRYQSDECVLLQLTKLIAHGCRVINISMGYPELPSERGGDSEKKISKKFDDAFVQLEKMNYDFLICKSAGNGDDKSGGYEAEKDQLNRILTNGKTARAHTIVVGAIGPPGLDPIGGLLDRLGGNKNPEIRYKYSSYSNYGDLVDVVAPGDKIYSTAYKNGTYMNKNGTSMASPMVAGVASLVYSVDPERNYKQVKTLVTNSSRNWVDRGGKIYKMVNAARAVALAKIKGATDPQKPPEIGFVRGIIQDAVTGDIIRGANILFISGSKRILADSDSGQGEYSVFLEPGRYDMICAMDGYKTEHLYNIEIRKGETTHNVLMRLLSSESGNGTARGVARNAFNAHPIPGAQLELYRGLDNTAGAETEKVMSLTCDGDGAYMATLPAGNYTVRGTAEGYLDSVANITVLDDGAQDADSSNGNQDVVLTPRLNPGEVRFVLTWGRNPSDLDSHLAGPAPDGRFHIWYSRRDFYFGGTSYDNLDVDDTTSFGPETTSIYRPVDGTYTYYVHDYTNRGKGSGSDLARSGAQVRVYVAGQAKPVVFNVPGDQGTLWKVCTVNGLEIRPVNTMSYESNPEKVGQ